ncbi:MAG: hypothetical protein HZB13_18660 [Acidobacteria bacterium]|nr:hypothetical protein [Acidobacteriota bacterium]
MTKVEVRYEFTTSFEDAWMPAIESLSSVYGLQQVRLDARLDSLTVCYDASRLRMPVRRMEAAA